MADDLDGKVYTVGTAGLEGLIWDFLRPPERDEPSLQNAAVALRIWRLGGQVKFTADSIPDKTRQLPPESPTPNLILTVGSGLVRITNSPNHITGSLQILPSQLLTLLGGSTIAVFNYLWVITPVGNGPSAKPLDGGYDGCFGLVREGYSLQGASKA